MVYQTPWDEPQSFTQCHSILLLFYPTPNLFIISSYLAKEVFRAHFTAVKSKT